MATDLETTAIIQARVNSTRLPNKVFAEIEGKPLIWHVVKRIESVKQINKIVVATSTNDLDDKLEKWCAENNVHCYRGSENNVLERFYFSAKQAKADIVVRVTSDDPFKDPIIIDKVINLLKSSNLDFAYNNNPPSFPEGLDTEVFTFNALETAYNHSSDPFELEHVTQHFYRNPNKFRQSNIFHTEDLSNLRWTIDRKEDLVMTRIVYKLLYQQDEIFKFEDILKLIEANPWIPEINSDVERSSMYQSRGKNEKNK